MASVSPFFYQTLSKYCKSHSQSSGHFPLNLFDERDKRLVMTTMSETKRVAYVCYTFASVCMHTDDIADLR